MTFTLFIPVLNEIECLPTIMPEVLKVWKDEIIVVDGVSTDGTVEWFANSANTSGRCKFWSQVEPGLGNAWKTCLKYATGDVIIAFSPDGNSDPALLPKLRDTMNGFWQDGQPVYMITASRYYRFAYSDDDTWLTAFGNWMFTKLVNLLFHANYTDVLVMYRAVRRDLFDHLNIDLDHLPTVEMQFAIKCAKGGFRAIDIPGTEPKRIGGYRKMRPWWNGWHLLMTIWRELWQKEEGH